MDKPLAFKLNDSGTVKAYCIAVDPVGGVGRRSGTNNQHPAIIVAQAAHVLPSVSAGVLDSADIVASIDGDWTRAILIVLPQARMEDTTKPSTDSSDADFLAQVNRKAPGLADLASETVIALRNAGIDGKLVEGTGGRWVNRPLNTFTLKAQPRVGNLSFTLYGNPETYDAEGFLLKDQNSYSRGWITNSDDVARLASLAWQAHARRMR